jgi:arsenate reductase
LKIKIYHNPKCSKSREALALLQQKKIAPEIVEFLKNPPTEAELVAILAALKLSARDVLRTKEPEYKELGLSNQKITEKQIIGLIVSNPKLLERPIVVNGKKAVIGRPTENILAIL